DVFVADDAGAGKLAWINGWRKLPHLTRDVEKLFDYPQQFAEDIFDRIEQAFRRRVSRADAKAVVATGRLFIGDADVPDLPAPYIRSWDEQYLRDRREGKFLVSYQTRDGRRAVIKTMLSEVLGAGRDVKIA